MPELPAGRRLDQPLLGPRGLDFDPSAFASAAERIARFLGTGRYLAIQTVIVIVWIGLNLVSWQLRWDPYPFILLNLAFSTQAAYAAPLLLLSQNRQAERDRIKAEHDYRINQLALQFLIAWHRDAHPPGCACVRELGPAADTALAELAHDLTSPMSPPDAHVTAVSPPAASAARTPDSG